MSRLGREAFKSTPAMATTTAITIATGIMANARNYGPLVCTRRSWANKVREIANDIAKCAGEDSFAIPLPTGRSCMAWGQVAEASMGALLGPGHRLPPERLRTQRSLARWPLAMVARAYMPDPRTDVLGRPEIFPLEFRHTLKQAKSAAAAPSMAPFPPPAISCRAPCARPPPGSRESNHGKPEGQRQLRPKTLPLDQIRRRRSRRRQAVLRRYPQRRSNPDHNRHNFRIRTLA